MPKLVYAQLDYLENLSSYLFGRRDIIKHAFHLQLEFREDISSSPLPGSYYTLLKKTSFNVPNFEDHTSAGNDGGEFYIFEDRVELPLIGLKYAYYAPVDQYYIYQIGFTRDYRMHVEDLARVRTPNNQQPEICRLIKLEGELLWATDLRLLRTQS